MRLEEKLELFKNKGFTYNKDTGEIFSWTGNKINNNDGHGYIRCCLWLEKKTVNISAHQLAWYLGTGEVPTIIDHINHNRSDNRLINLRNLNNQKNSFNRTGIKGCTYNKRIKKWQAKITLNNKAIHLGTFNSQKDAHNSYLEAKKVYHLL